jgi:hypothetical protein
VVILGRCFKFGSGNGTAGWRLGWSLLNEQVRRPLEDA